MRNISESIWKDDWFAERSLVDKVIWIGIITKIADDQGRFRDNARLIQSELFPMSDNPSIEDIKISLDIMKVDEKLISYQVGGKGYLQVKNWWKYQNSANWMKASEYPAPDKWNDWYRYQSKGGKVVDSHKAGGVARDKAGLQDTLQAPLQDPLQGGYVNDNDNDNVKDNDNSATDDNHSSAVQVDKDFAEIARLYESEIGILSAIIRDDLSEMYTEFGAQFVKDGIVEASRANVRKIGYIRSCCRNWKTNGRNSKPPQKKQEAPVTARTRRTRSLD